MGCHVNSNSAYIVDTWKGQDLSEYSLFPALILLIFKLLCCSQKSLIGWCYSSEIVDSLRLFCEWSLPWLLSDHVTNHQPSNAFKRKKYLSGDRVAGDAELLSDC